MAHPNAPAFDPRVAEEFAHQVVQRLQQSGFQAYWAGGCVRDRVMGREPKDYDVATSATPDQVRSIFGRRRTLPVGTAFGVVAILGPPESGPIEVATFRRDEGYSDGRHPDHVSFSTPEEDAKRRDFTINGLFYDPSADRILDFVQGRADIAGGLIRCIGDPHERISEDKLRMLRAVRFATVLGFHVDAQTHRAIVDHADEIDRVSGERIGAEMRHILRHPCRVIGLDLIHSTGLWRSVLPEYGLGDEEHLARDWQTMSNIVRELPAPASIPLVLAALFWPTCTPPTIDATVDALTERWRLTNVENKSVKWLLGHLDVIRNARRIRWPKLQRILIEPLAGELVELARAVELSLEQADADLRDCDFAQQRLHWPPQVLNPPPLINGNDLMQLGITPGPAMGRWLKLVRDAQLEDKLSSREEALAWVRADLPRRDAADVSGD